MFLKYYKILKSLQDEDKCDRQTIRLYHMVGYFYTLAGIIIYCNVLIDNNNKKIN
jgi:hypothetical protein